MRSGRAETAAGTVTTAIRQRIERGGERLWRPDDFREYPFTAVAQALSRLKRDGTLERLSKGVYYRSRNTAFGKAVRTRRRLKTLALPGIRSTQQDFAAANLLGHHTNRETK